MITPEQLKAAKHAMDRRVEYVRRMSGGYPTGEKP